MKEFLLSASLLLSCAWNVSAADDNKPILEQPAGTSVNYDQKAVAYELYGTIFDSYIVSQLGNLNSAATIVDGDDGFTYVNGIIAGDSKVSWIKGKRDGNKITIPLPQPYCYLTDREGNTNVYSLYIYDCDNSNKKTVYTRSDIDELVLTVTEDNRVILNIDYDESTVGNANPVKPNTILGMGDANGDYRYVGVAYSEFTPIQGKYTTPPADLVTEKMAISADYFGRMIDFGFHGDEAYIRGISELFPDVWVKGKREGNKIAFKSGQLLGIYLDVWNYFWGGTYNPETKRLSMGDSIVFDYDETTKTLTCDKNAAFFSNGSTKTVAWTSFARDPIIKIQDYDAPVTLIAPVFVDYYPEYMGRHACVFDIANITKENNLIDLDKLFYRYYYNGQLETFYPDEYPVFKEETTDIPWLTFDDLTYGILYSKATHTVMYVANGVLEIGCQTVYKDGDKEILSPITTVNVLTGEITTGIDNVSATPAATATTEYFDLQGRRVAQPGSGLYIRRSTAADGTVVTDKIIR